MGRDHDDPRALSDPRRHARNAGTYYDPNEIQLQLSFNAAYTGNLHLYAVDWDSEGRREILSRQRAERGALERLQPGRLGLLPDQRRRRGNGLDHSQPTGRRQRRAVGHLPRGRRACPRPNGESAPQGKWVSAVGSSRLCADRVERNRRGRLLPAQRDAQPSQQGSRYEWAATRQTPRALTDPGEQTRNAGTYYDPNQIQMQLSFKAAYSGNLHLYALDWDSQGRREIISVNGQSVVLSSDFSQGAWVSFPISVAAGGTVSITVTRAGRAQRGAVGDLPRRRRPSPRRERDSSPQGTLGRHLRLGRL